MTSDLLPELVARERLRRSRWCKLNCLPVHELQEGSVPPLHGLITGLSTKSQFQPNMITIRRQHVPDLLGLATGSGDCTIGAAFETQICGWCTRQTTSLRLRLPHHPNFGLGGYEVLRAEENA
jgi:hypothetical protein